LWGVTATTGINLSPDVTTPPPLPSASATNFAPPLPESDSNNALSITERGHAIEFPFINHDANLSFQNRHTSLLLSNTPTQLKRFFDLATT
jgi:hypothetical protein